MKNSPGEMLKQPKMFKILKQKNRIATWNVYTKAT